MLTIKEKGTLFCIIDHCERIEKTIDGVKQEEFYRDIDKKEIVCFNLLQIGELAKKLSEVFIGNNSGVPWKKIKGMRDRIVHGYGSIQTEFVWQTASKDIEPLRRYCELLLKQD